MTRIVALLAIALLGSGQTLEITGDLLGITGDLLG